jgi:peptide/nickel transport system substrate-binding protein
MRIAFRTPALLIALLAACSGSEHSAAKPKPTTLVMALPADADNLLPPFSTNELSVQVSSVLFERLAEIGDSLHYAGDDGFQPSLANSWTWAPDSMSIAFHLDPKAHWQDGVPVRAADVVYSYRVNTSKVIGSPIGPLITNIDSVTASDSLTPVFWFHARKLEQFYDVTQIRVLPAHLLASIPDSALSTSKYGRNPVGSGPYKFVRWVSGSTVEVDADSTFHRGKPRIDRVIWSIAQNPDASILRLLSGEANFTESLRKQDREQISRHPELKTFRYPSMLVYYVRLNERARGGRHGPHPIFGDREVRRALTMAIDRRRAVSTVFDSTTRVAKGPITSALPTYDASLPSLPYAPDSATAILERHGWVMGKDGIRHKGAVPLQFSMLVPVTSTQRQQMAVLLQDMWKKVGARLDIEAVDFPTLGARESARDFDTAFEGMTLDPTPSGIRQEWSTAAALAGGTSNTGSYMSAAFDKAVDSAVSTMDPAVAIAEYRRAYATIIEDAPGIWMYESPAFAGMSLNIHPAPMRADVWFAHLAEWTIGDAPAPKGESVALAAGAH